jgi:hypothetical protein
MICTRWPTTLGTACQGKWVAHWEPFPYSGSDPLPQRISPPLPERLQSGNNRYVRSILARKTAINAGIAHYLDVSVECRET